MTTTEKGFTLIELMVVLGIIATLMAAFVFSVSSAQQRAKLAKAESEVKIISQAILGYETMSRDGLSKLPSEAEISADQYGFLLGKGGQMKYSGEKIPATLLAALASNGTMNDPWGTPYRVRVKKQQIGSVNSLTSLKMRYRLPNGHRLSEGERQ